MATIFENRPGQAVALEDSLDTPMALRIDDWSGYASMKAIITEIGIELDGSYQFLHTLQDLIYVYVFGDRIGKFRVAGMAFADTCTGDGPAGGPTGIENVLAFHRRNRIAARARPSQLQIGTTQAGHFQGFLTRVKGDIFKPEARISQFGLEYGVFPEATR